MTRDSVLVWLQGRQPQPPVTLARQLARRIEIAADSAFEGDSIAQVVGALGVTSLREVVERQNVAYDAALDLLAADAFVTYAFEAVSEEGGDVTGLARRLLVEVRG